MKTITLKSGREVRLSSLTAQLDLYEWEIEALVEAIELAHQHKKYVCCSLVKNLQDLRDYFLFQQGHQMLDAEVYERWLALPKGQLTKARLAKMRKEAGL